MIFGMSIQFGKICILLLICEDFIFHLCETPYLQAVSYQGGTIGLTEFLLH